MIVYLEIAGTAYELPIDTDLTGYEARTVKQISGRGVAEIPAALIAGDHDVKIALARIACERQGVDMPEAALLALPITAIAVVVPELEPVDDVEEVVEQETTAARTKPGQRHKR